MFPKNKYKKPLYFKKSKASKYTENDKYSCFSPTETSETQRKHPSTHKKRGKRKENTNEYDNRHSSIKRRRGKEDNDKYDNRHSSNFRNKNQFYDYYDDQQSSYSYGDLTNYDTRSNLYDYTTEEGYYRTKPGQRHARRSEYSLTETDVFSGDSETEYDTWSDYRDEQRDRMGVHHRRGRGIKTPTLRKKRKEYGDYDYETEQDQDEPFEEGEYDYDTRPHQTRSNQSSNQTTDYRSEPRNPYRGDFNVYLAHQPIGHKAFRATNNTEVISEESLTESEGALGSDNSQTTVQDEKEQPQYQIYIAQPEVKDILLPTSPYNEKTEVSEPHVDDKLKSNSGEAQSGLVYLPVIIMDNTLKLPKSKIISPNQLLEKSMKEEEEEPKDIQVYVASNVGKNIFEEPKQVMSDNMPQALSDGENIIKKQKSGDSYFFHGLRTTSPSKSLESEYQVKNHYMTVVPTEKPCPNSKKQTSNQSSATICLKPDEKRSNLVIEPVDNTLYKISSEEAYTKINGDNRTQQKQKTESMTTNKNENQDLTVYLAASNENESPFVLKAEGTRQSVVMKRQSSIANDNRVYKESPYGKEQQQHQSELMKRQSSIANDNAIYKESFYKKEQLQRQSVVMKRQSSTAKDNEIFKQSPNEKEQQKYTQQSVINRKSSLIGGFSQIYRESPNEEEEQQYTRQSVIKIKPSLIGSCSKIYRGRPTEKKQKYTLKSVLKKQPSLVVNYSEIYEESPNEKEQQKSTRSIVGDSPNLINDNQIHTTDVKGSKIYLTGDTMQQDTRSTIIRNKDQGPNERKSKVNEMKSRQSEKEIASSKLDTVREQRRQSSVIKSEPTMFQPRQTLSEPEERKSTLSKIGNKNRETATQIKAKYENKKSFKDNPERDEEHPHKDSWGIIRKNSKKKNTSLLKELSSHDNDQPLKLWGFNATPLICLFEMSQFFLGLSLHDKIIEVINSYYLKND